TKRGRTTTTSSTGSRRSSSASPVSSLRGSVQPARVRGTSPPSLTLADLVWTGDRARPAAGLQRALPDLEPWPQRHPAPPTWLGHPPERLVLHHLPRRHTPCDGARPARLLLARLGADRAWAGTEPSRA